MTDIAPLMRRAPVIPVLTVADVAAAQPLAAALVEGGLPVIEVTLRTPAALDVLAAMREVPGAIVGAGTVISAAQAEEAAAAGAAFIVSPGLHAPVAERVLALGIPFLPGVATASDLMRGLDLGLTHFKFFPATAAGGIPALRALAAPFAQCRFCPTGGITAATAPDWLALPSVLCVGGSWVAEGAPAEITRLAADAARLRDGSAT